MNQRSRNSDITWKLSKVEGDEKKMTMVASVTPVTSDGLLETVIYNCDATFILEVRVEAMDR